MTIPPSHILCQSLAHLRRASWWGVLLTAATCRGRSMPWRTRAPLCCSPARPATRVRRPCRPRAAPATCRRACGGTQCTLGQEEGSEGKKLDPFKQWKLQTNQTVNTKIRTRDSGNVGSTFHAYRVWVRPRRWARLWWGWVRGRRRGRGWEGWVQAVRGRGPGTRCCPRPEAAHHSYHLPVSAVGRYRSPPGSCWPCDDIYH